jgi:phage regulator Rha-like protein
MNQLIPSVGAAATMTSREIADLCEKDHKHVLADVRVMCEGLKIDSAEFSAQYKDSTGRTLPCFNLPKDLSMTLVSGYNVVLRKRIVDRWLKLEAHAPAPFVIPSTLAGALRLAAEQAEQIEAQVAQLEAAAPAVEFVDKYVDATGTKASGRSARWFGSKSRYSATSLSSKASCINSVENGCRTPSCSVSRSILTIRPCASSRTVRIYLWHFRDYVSDIIQTISQ